MRSRQRLRQLLNPFIQMILVLQASVFALWLEVLNRLSGTGISGEAGPVVSLTSYGKRIETVHLTIESVLRGRLLPSRLILWLDDESLFHHLPLALERLKRRGVEVRLTQNWGPHTKYFPWIEQEVNFDRPLVTADDDILYPRYWLEQLMNAYIESPTVIHCYRAREVVVHEAQLGRYEEWALVRDTRASIRNLGTGVSGVIYPPEMLLALKKAGQGFVECCPKADDLWLHVQALRNGFKVRQIVPKALHFLLVPGTQWMALQNTNRNTFHSGNDQQAAQTYLASDLELLRCAERES